MAEALIDFDILEQISLLLWAQTGNSEMAEKLATVKLVADLWKKFSSTDRVEELRAVAILKITKYVQEHPQATQEELSAEVGRQIAEFAHKVESL